MSSCCRISAGSTTCPLLDTVVVICGKIPSYSVPRQTEAKALLVDECALGRLSRGKVAGLLGLGFHDTEALLRGPRVPYPIKTSDDDAFDNALLTKRQ